MKYFTMAEMTNSETAKKRGIKNEPNPTQRANIETLVNELLDKVRERWGKEKPPHPRMCRRHRSRHTERQSLTIRYDSSIGT